jgi:hypothetical protein
LLIWPNGRAASCVVISRPVAPSVAVFIAASCDWLDVQMTPSLASGRVSQRHTAG